MTHWIVDASNVMGSRPDGWWRDRPLGLFRLLDEIARWRHETGAAVTVVADGYPTPRVPEGELYGVDVRYAHSSRTDAADDVIVDIVARARDTEAITVVTSDRRLRARVTDAGCSIEGSRRFLSRIAEIDSRQRDRAVLQHFGIDESALLGRGGEARVFAIDEEQVLRLPHPGVDVTVLEERRRLLDRIAAGAAPVAIPIVVEHKEVEGRTVVVERRLRGDNAIEVLAARHTDRAELIRHHLQVALSVADLPYPRDGFGELYGPSAITAPSFSQWAVRRLTASLRAAGEAFASVDAESLTADLVAALPEGEPSRPRLVHLDAFLGNMLAADNRITALLDFGPMTIGGPPYLDALVAVAYLAPEITPTATDDDRTVALAWLEEHGLAGAGRPAERWIAAYWTGAVGDERLQAWCGRMLTS